MDDAPDVVRIESSHHRNEDIVPQLVHWLNKQWLSCDFGSDENFVNILFFRLILNVGASMIPAIPGGVVVDENRPHFHLC